MKRVPYSWLASPLFLLMTTTCGDNGQLGGGDCLSGVDSDGDGLTDDIECRIGSDAKNPDTNGDGISDGDAYNMGLDPVKLDSDGDGVPDATELRYPKICVADERNFQRRPPTVCQASTDCQAGETCKGLDPLKTDSDGDTVDDRLEDIDYNGTIDFSTGETDPRLFDTDGDGSGDKNAGSQICRPDGLGTVVQQPLSGIQLGHDPAFGTASVIANATMNRSAGVVDDTATGVAGMVVSAPTALADLTADRIAIEGSITTALTTAGATVTTVFVGQQFTTHEVFPASQSTFRVVKTASNASALRDAVVSTLTGGTAPGGKSVGVDASNQYYLDVTVVRRNGINDIIVGLSPKTQYDDLTSLTAIRANDLTNSSGVAEGNKVLDYECQGIVADKNALADIIWTVDISRSMDGNQVALASTATNFFNRMRAAGVDFRVGVFNAFSPETTVPMLSNMTYACFPNGFKFISGADTQGSLALCRQVTSTEAGTNGYCPLDMPKTNDTCAPFGKPDGADHNEEPVAAAVLVNNMFVTNAANMVTNQDWKWRPGATRVAFMVTDEFGTNNDWGRYFQTANIPGVTPAARFAPGGTYNQGARNNIVKYFKDNQILTFGAVRVAQGGTTRACTADNTNDVPRCIIEGAGGAYYDIDNAAQTDVDAAMDRLVTAVVGASSTFQLTRTPITSTIKVTVRNQLVPRSRSNGFDYNPTSRSVVFYGNTYRPQIGDQVYISYRIWKGSLG